MADGTSRLSRAEAQRRREEFDRRYALHPRDVDSPDAREADALSKEVALPYEMPSLHKAAFENDTRALLRLLSAGAQINMPDEDGNTALHYAAENLAIGTCRLLLEHGALHKWNSNGQYPFNAALKEEESVVRGTRRLKDLTDRPLTRLFLEYREIYPTISRTARYLSESGVPAKRAEKTPLVVAIERNNIDAIREAITTAPESIHTVDDYGRTPLYFAAARGRSRACDMLLAHGAENAPMTRPYLSTPLDAARQLMQHAHHKAASDIAKTEYDELHLRRSQAVLRVFQEHGIFNNKARHSQRFIEAEEARQASEAEARAAEAARAEEEAHRVALEAEAEARREIAAKESGAAEPSVDLTHLAHSIAETRRIVADAARAIEKLQAESKDAAVGRSGEAAEEEAGRLSADTSAPAAMAGAGAAAASLSTMSVAAGAAGEPVATAALPPAMLEAAQHAGKAPAKSR